MEYDKLELIDAKAEKLLDAFNADDDIAAYTNALYFIIVLFVIAVCFLYVFEGYPFLAFSLALLSLIPYRIIVGKAAARTDALALYNTFDNKDKSAYTTSKLKYLGSLIKLKRARLIALRMVYMTCFPVWLYMLSILVFERELSFKYEWMFILPALLAGVAFWYFFFSKEISELTNHKDEVKGIIANIESQ